MSKGCDFGETDEVSQEIREQNRAAIVDIFKAARRDDCLRFNVRLCNSKPLVFVWDLALSKDYAGVHPLVRVERQNRLARDFAATHENVEYLEGFYHLHELSKDGGLNHRENQMTTGQIIGAFRMKKLN